VNFGQAITSGFQGYVQFSGRSSRSEYWFFMLFTTIIAVIISIFDALGSPRLNNFSVFSLIWSLAVLLPQIAVGIRRLHDLEKSGWWLLITLIPLIGAIVFIIWCCTEGTEGDNRFGANPLGGSAPAHTAVNVAQAPDERYGIVREVPRPINEPIPTKPIATEVATTQPEVRDLSAQASDDMGKLPQGKEDVVSEDFGRKFALLLEYDPEVKSAYEDVEPLGEKYAERFVSQVTADRHKATEVRDALVREWESILNEALRPYQSDEMNDALAQARELGEEAESEFKEVIDVLGEAADAKGVINKIREKYYLEAKINNASDEVIDTSPLSTPLSRFRSINDAYDWALERGASWAKEFERYHKIFGAEMNISDTKEKIEAKIRGDASEYNGFKIISFNRKFYIENRGLVSFNNRSDAQKYIDDL
jgi:uncharacterized membrane protein YhaH (DUF805 family)